MLSDRELRCRVRGLASDGTTPAEPLVVVPLLHPKLGDGGAIQGSSIDLSLGTWFETPRLYARMGHELKDAPADGEKSGKSMFVPFGGAFYLHPGRFVLAVSLEWIRMPADLSQSPSSTRSSKRSGGADCEQPARVKSQLETPVRSEKLAGNRAVSPMPFCALP